MTPDTNERLEYCQPLVDGYGFGKEWGGNQSCNGLRSIIACGTIDP